MNRSIFIMAVILGIGLGLSANGATITAVSSGGWYTNSTWSCNCQPGNNDNVVIPAGITVSITSGPVILTGGPVITVSISGTLSLISGGTLIVDANDIVKVMNGGKVSGTGILDAVWSGGTPIWVPNGTSINGPSVITSGSLPIILLDFYAELFDRSITLKWASATEINFDHYVIGRSTDGIHFEDIGHVAGSGTSAHRAEYAFEDLSPLSGKSYYRLQSVDLDLTTQAFDIVMVDWLSTAVEPLTIYPNPMVGSDLHALVNVPGSEGGQIAIYDSQGKVIAQQGIQPSQNLYSVELPQSVGHGIYFVVVKAGSHNIKKTLIVP